MRGQGRAARRGQSGQLPCVQSAGAAGAPGRRPARGRPLACLMSRSVIRPISPADCGKLGAGVDLGDCRCSRRRGQLDGVGGSAAVSSVEMWIAGGLRCADREREALAVAVASGKLHNHRAKVPCLNPVSRLRVAALSSPAPANPARPARGLNQSARNPFIASQERLCAPLPESASAAPSGRCRPARGPMAGPRWP